MSSLSNGIDVQKNMQIGKTLYLLQLPSGQKLVHQISGFLKAILEIGVLLQNKSQANFSQILNLSPKFSRIELSKAMLKIRKA
ncbi:hypothetical protein [Bartonella sp. HY038]|uniref:hypothetical protein n=1 Tax=Bartonella sp. HY038 TaxID=2759660 RepID=UPI0015FD6B8D|nr:hypothetical protein [Bartonella sp. HY038]